MQSDNSLFYELGSYGPFVIIFFSMFLLWDKPNMFFFYMVGLTVDTITNIILKGIIQQPRPGFNSKDLQLAIKNNKQYLFKDGIPFNIFGMPSGHSSIVMFSTVFVYLTLKKTKWLYVYLPFCGVIISQRVYYGVHTISQVTVGAVIGTLIAFFVYNFAEKSLKRSIREKPDDYAPI